MHCAQVQTLLEAYLDGDLPEPRRAALDAHLRDCAQCRETLVSEQTLRDALRQLPVEPPQPGFAARALRRARETHQAAGGSRPRRRGFVAGFATALAASLALWAIVTVFVADQSQISTPTVTVAVNEVRTLRLAFDSPAELEQVTVHMQLPENFALAGRTSQRELRWQTQLGKGRNVLTLPIVAVGEGNGELTARIEHKRKQKTFRIRLQTREKPGSSQRIGGASLG